MNKDFDTLFPEEVESRSNLDHSTFVAEYLDRNRPVVIRGGVSNWPAIERWTPDYLVEKIGKKQAKIGTISPTPVEPRNMEVEELIRTIENQPVQDGKTLYLTKLNIHDVFPELSEDVRPHPHVALPDRLENRLLMDNLHYPKRQMEMLVGGGGLGFPLHYDRGFMHAFIMQIYGEKDAVAIPYEQVENLYPSEHFGSVSSIENIWQPDFERFPKLRDVRGYRVRLKPGDLLFMPCGWWHATRLPGLSMGATCNAVSRGNWPRFKQFFLESKRKKQGLHKVAVWWAYLTIAGLTSRLHEALFGR